MIGGADGAFLAKLAPKTVALREGRHFCAMMALPLWMLDDHCRLAFALPAFQRAHVIAQPETLDACNPHRSAALRANRVVNATRQR